MGLTTWKSAPDGPIRKSDITIAKNYLTADELQQLNLIVDQYLSFAELQARAIFRSVHTVVAVAESTGFALSRDNCVQQYENRSKQKKAMHMADWLKKLHDFLMLNDREILSDLGKVSHELACELAAKEFEKFQQKQRQFEANNPVSDFDNAVKRIEDAKRKRPPKKP
jgi:hypothetical protein